MKIGGHVSTAGGLNVAIDNAVKIGAEAIQIFASSPRSWNFSEPKEEDVSLFLEKANKFAISPIFLHGVYLVNLGNAVLLEKSINSLTQHMLVASSIHAKGVIFHCGSRKGFEFEEVLPQIAHAIKEVLRSTPDDVSLIFENSAGMGSSIRSNFEEIEAIFSKVNNDRLGLCLDTQHCYASGYDLTKDEGVDLLISQIKPIGIEKILAVHANDSKVPFDAGVDRHENIGEGFIGIKGFEKIMAVEELSEVPFILEVPGFGKVRGPDEENVNRLKKLRLD